MQFITKSALTVIGFLVAFSGATKAEPGDSQTAVPYVGAYYYPWFDAPDAALKARNPILAKLQKRGGEKWQKQVMRSHLRPQHLPALGHYNSYDPAVISDHIRQSQRGNISFWASSWWGPGSKTDIILKDHILKHPEAGKLKYAILYESPGRIKGKDRNEKFSNLDYSHVVSDFKYLKKTYFDNPNYLKIDGKAVVYVYLGRRYFRGQGHDILAKVREAVPDVYIVSDDVFAAKYEAEWAKPFDAITAYDVYGQSTKIYGGTRKAITSLATLYKGAREQANSVGVALIPAIAPGYNDRAVRDGNVGRSRKFSDEPASQEGDIFRAMIADVALPNLDPKTNNMMIITSFNEWYEDSQIEATTGSQGCTTKDDSATGNYFTHGENYCDYGYLYLDILADYTRRPVSKNR